MSFILSYFLKWWVYKEVFLISLWNDEKMVKNANRNEIFIWECRYLRDVWIYYFYEERDEKRGWGGGGKEKSSCISASDSCKFRSNCQFIQRSFSPPYCEDNERYGKESFLKIGRKASCWFYMLMKFVESEGNSSLYIFNYSNW